MRVVIVYGSEYGNAKAIAENIHAVLLLFIQCQLLSAKDHAQIDFDDSDEKILILVTSTYNGGAPTNAVAFLRRIRARGPETLSNLKVAVLGIGDTNYDDFCGAAKKFEKYLIENGASRLVTGPMKIQGIYGGPVGTVDDSCDPNDFIDPWINHLEATMKTIVQQRVDKEAAIKHTAQRTRLIATAICASAALIMAGRFRRP